MSEKTSRNMEIMFALRRGDSRKEVAARYGISVPRVDQIFKRGEAIEAKIAGVSVAVWREHTTARDNGEEGRGYSKAVCLSKRQELKAFEKACRDVEQACREMEEIGLRDMRKPVRDVWDKSEYRLNWQKATVTFREIRKIKVTFDGLSEPLKSQSKEPMALEIDGLLGRLAATGHDYRQMLGMVAHI